MTEQVIELKAEETPKPVAEAPQPTTDAAVIEKVQKGEKLSDEETETFMSLPTEQLPRPGEAAPVVEEAKKPEEKKPETVVEERRALIEAEVGKAEGSQDLTKFTPIELGLYWDLRKSRSRNQKLTEELEISRIETIVKGMKGDDKAKEEAVEEDPLKILEGMTDDDIPTVGQLRKLTEALKKKPAEAKPVPIRSQEQVRLEKIEATQTMTAKGIKDFSEVVEFAEIALAGDESARDVLRGVARSGGNVVEQTYWLIKGSKAWPDIEKAINAEKAKVAPKVTEENLNRAKKIEENAAKVKTTGPSTGAPANSKEYSVSEIAGMTHRDIRGLSKEKRQAILEKFGSNPNYSV